MLPNNQKTDLKKNISKDFDINEWVFLQNLFCLDKIRRITYT